MTIVELLEKTAEVLEKSAVYLENIETTRVASEREHKTKEAAALAEKIADAVGEPINEDLISKLANASPEVQVLLGRLAGSDEVESLGGPSREVKTASIEDGSTSHADARFLNWVQS